MEQLQGIAVQLGIDQSFIPLFILIAGLYLILSAVYLRPYQHLILERRKKSASGKGGSQDLFASADLRAQEYEAKLKALHGSTKNLLSETEAHARKDEANILKDADLKAKQMYKKLQEDLQHERATAMQQLDAQVPALAANIASKLLGRDVGAK